MIVPLPGMFYWRNKGKAIPLFFLVASSVLVISLVATLTGSVLRASYQANVKPYEAFSFVASKQMGISQDMLTQLAASEYVETIIPVLDSRIKVKGISGSEGRRVLAIPMKDADYFLGKSRLMMKEGRLPRDGEDGIAIHEQIAVARGVGIGDLVGREVYPDDYLWGMFQVTGILRGDVPLAIASLDYFKAQWAMDTSGLEFAYLVFPETGKLSEMNSFLTTLPAQLLLVQSLETARDYFESESQNMDLMLWIVNFLVVVIISLAMGLLNTVHFQGRLKEFGLLAAIGLTPKRLAYRAFQEIVILALTGFALGIALGKGILIYISSSIFGPKGIGIAPIGLRGVLFALPVPLLLSLFSFLTIGWHLLRLDYISVMEGRD